MLRGRNGKLEVLHRGADARNGWEVDGTRWERQEREGGKGTVFRRLQRIYAFGRLETRGECSFCAALRDISLTFRFDNDLNRVSFVSTRLTRSSQNGTPSSNRLSY